jgi:hypothetical protein
VIDLTLIPNLQPCALSCGVSGCAVFFLLRFRMIGIVFLPVVSFAWHFVLVLGCRYILTRHPTGGLGRPPASLTKLHFTWVCRHCFGGTTPHQLAWPALLRRYDARVLCLAGTASEARRRWSCSVGTTSEVRRRWSCSVGTTSEERRRELMQSPAPASYTNLHFTWVQHRVSHPHLQLAMS